MQNYGLFPALWGPFVELRQLQSQTNRMFDGGGRNQRQSDGNWPPVNLWPGDDSLIVTAEMPGVAQDDIEPTVRENTLIIAGKRSPSTEDGDAAWHRRERPSGAFSRSIRLPLRVDPDKVEARAENGVLEVEMSPPDAERPRKIEVKAS
ncbi:Hsp20/alpha crystallin family protein [Salipiger aestuarii]|uniref:HSP20 family protein n=1 Tax=Salipiger aestuarii TaxID=568098 RepID=A0A327XII0_9RHOB|nr:Hsp20/alpha crystallin family protein [Salipiger aestuarii]EIE52890.1 putative small heat-shock protein molecular chaperone [Citreicella sp. 357]RAK08878.1 HSP20 family protein [Salipiger aestuarii]